MVRTKADSVPGTYRKVVAARAPRKVLGSSTSATNSTPVSSRKACRKLLQPRPQSPPTAPYSLQPVSLWSCLPFYISTIKRQVKKQLQFSNSNSKSESKWCLEVQCGKEKKTGLHQIY
ncbi:hypothetical protein H8959_015782 [Pygathrix nigripes]